MLLNNDELTTSKEAVMGPDSVKMAIRHKIRDSIHIRNQVWNLVLPPEGMKPIKCKWIYKETNVDNRIHY